MTRSTTFAANSAEQSRAIGAGEIAGEFYPRYGHPAGRSFESAVATLEGAAGAVSFASGLAALHGVCCGLLRSGDTLAAARDLYGGTSALLDRDLPRFGITVRRFDARNLEATRAAILAGARLVLVESPTNPLARLVDLAAIAALAREAGCISCVDSTFAPPPLQHGIALGFDLVMHSATKFLGGHSDCLGGVVSGPHELLEVIEGFRRRSGGVLSADTAWMLLRSLRTLELRVRTASATAARIAGWLEQRRIHPAGGEQIERVHCAALESHPDHALSLRQMDGCSAVLAFEVAGGIEAACRVYDRFSTIARAVSLGGTETVALLPRYASHTHLSDRERAEAGIGDGVIRLSIGLESFDELVADLAAALQQPAD